MISFDFYSFYFITNLLIARYYLFQFDAELFENALVRLPHSYSSKIGVMLSANLSRKLRPCFYLRYRRRYLKLHTTIS